MISKVKANPNTKEAALIFGLTTPYPDGVTPTRIPEDAVKYNDAAIEVMKVESISVTDLYNPIIEHLATLQKPQNEHFNEQGSRQLGILVAESILEQLKSKGVVDKDVRLASVPEMIERPNRPHRKTAD